MGREVRRARKGYKNLALLEGLFKRWKYEINFVMRSTKFHAEKQVFDGFNFKSEEVNIVLVCS